jgi:hypothetical protein
VEFSSLLKAFGDDEGKSLFLEQHRHKNKQIILSVKVV